MGSRLDSVDCAEQLRRLGIEPIVRHVKVGANLIQDATCGVQKAPVSNQFAWRHFRRRLCARTSLTAIAVSSNRRKARPSCIDVAPTCTMRDDRSMPVDEVSAQSIAIVAAIHNHALRFCRGRPARCRRLTRIAASVSDELDLRRGCK